MTLNIEALGRRIRTVRKRRGMSQNMLAEMIDKSPTYLSYIEHGSKCMSLDTFVDIANALNATADDLLIDSLENTIIVTGSSFISVLSDCDSYEQRILLDLVVSMKTILRSNKDYFPKRYIKW